ncbi:MAG: Fic family protein [Magnetococcales bacterium]|nr:Fic family protein [Magnetococcales bacterium]
MYDFIVNPEEIAHLENMELRALAEIWRERKGQLQESGEYQEFLKKMQREWAIETGIIERLYTWDRGVTETLIEQGIEAALIAHRGGVHREEAEHISSMIKDHYNIVEGLFSFVKDEQTLSEHYIRTLHAEFTIHQDSIEAQTEDGRPVRLPLLKGEYKKQPNNPLRQDDTIHTYCPPEHVQQEMNNLVSWYKEWEEKQAPPEFLSAFLHHRFTQIHPFQDGNGRVARALASLVFLKSGLFLVVIRDRDRKMYIQALENADQGDLKPLCDLFAYNQRESILAALGIEQSVHQARHAEEILASGLQLLKERFASETNRMDRVFEYAETLRKKTENRFAAIVDTMNTELSALTPPGLPRAYRALRDSQGNHSEKRQYFRNEIIQVAGKYKYHVNFSKNCSWASMTIQTMNHFQFVVALHGMGPVHKGIMAASGFTLFRVPREGQKGTETTDIQPASPDYFQFNYVESQESVEKRFQEWLESSLAIALAEWRRSIAREVAT